MPETATKLPGVGSVSPRQRNVIFLVAAGALGFVGYAWWSRGVGAAEPEVDFLVPEEPTGVLPFGGTTGGTFTEGPVAFRNDQEWYDAALDRLLFDYGIGETSTAAAALDRYLSGQALTATQIPLINYVINSIGPPPSGARQIRQEQVTPKTPSALPAAPSTVSAKGGKARATTTWSAVPGATSYEIRAIAGGSPGTGLPWRNVGTARSWTATLRVLKPKTYAFGVRAVNDAGKGPERRSNNVRVNP